MVQKLVLVLIYLTVLVNVLMYDHTCPSDAEWTIRSADFCNNTAEYLCLYDIINEQYVERCEGPRWDRIGAKRIISGSITRGDCSERRFQPFKFWTNGSSDCAFEKYLCNEDGQLVYSKGSAMEDRSCRCDHDRGYAFVKMPNNKNYCFPATEDCTCYLKTCPRYFQLSIDYECHSTSTVLYSSSSTFEELTVSRTHSEGIRENDLTWMFVTEYNNRKNAAIAAVMLFIVFVVLVPTAYFIQRRTKLSLGICLPLLKIFCGNDIQKVDGASHNFTEPKSGHRVVFSNRITDQLGLVENDEINYVRMMHLLFRVATPIVRIIFDREFHPEKLQKTLFENKIKLKELRKTNQINQDQWHILFQPKNGKTVSSEQFDIRLMICLIGVMSDKNIGELRPVSMHTSPDADLSRIKFIRNMITQSASGQLADEEFIHNWTDLTQAILRLGTAELRNIDKANRDKAQLLERIVKLSPLNYEKESLYKLITLVEEYYPEILNQIIKQHCVRRQTSLEDLLNSEKHNLFHMRCKSKECCKCGNHPSRILAENLWEQLFDEVDGKKVHPTCFSNKTCSEYFVPKQDLRTKNLDVLAAVSLILHIPSLFEQFCDRMFSSGFHVFLQEQQHTIFHAMTHEKCCKCVKNNNTIFKSKIMIDRHDWSHLFKKLRLSAEHSLKKPSQYYCSQSNCCCKYRCVKDLKHSSIDRSLLYKILKISGPFHYFDCIGEKLLLHGNLDDDRLVKINMETKKTLDALLNVLWDGKTKYELRQKIFSLESLRINDERRGVVQKWLLKQLQDKKTGETTLPLTSILVQDKGWVLKDVPRFMESETSILQKRTFELLTQEERNFLRIVHSLERIVCPAVREKFNYKCPPRVLEEILVNLYHGRDNKSTTKTNNQHDHKPRLKMYLTKTQMDILYPSSGKTPSSDDFDLKLMIYILKQHREQQDKNDDIVVDDDIKSDLSTINSIRRKIMQSHNGLLSNTEFQEYWTTLKQVAIRFGGEKYQTLCTELENRAASTALNK